MASKPPAELADDLEQVGHLLTQSFPLAALRESLVANTQPPAASAGARGTQGTAQAPANSADVMTAMANQQVGSIPGTALMDDSVGGQQITAGSIIVATTQQVDNGVGGGTSTVVITPTGITINNGALTFEDSYGDVVLTGLGFGGSWLDFIADNIYNSGFGASPISGNGSTITFYPGSNPLPGWGLTDEKALLGFGSTVGIVPTWDAEPASPSGGRVTMTMTNPGGTSTFDSFTVDQFIHIPNNRSQPYIIRPVILVKCVAFTGTAAVKYVAQFYNAGGATTGSLFQGATTLSSIGAGNLYELQLQPNGWGAPPSDATVVRVRFGLIRQSGTTATLHLLSCRLEIGHQQAIITDGTDTAHYGPGTIYQQGGILSLAQNQGTGVSGSSGLLQLDGSGATPYIDSWSQHKFENGVLLWGQSPATPLTGYSRIDNAGGDSGLTLRTDAGATYTAAAVGRLTDAFPVGMDNDDVATATTNLIAVSGGLGGAIAVPFLVAAPMAFYSVTVWSADATLTRSAQFRLYVDRGDGTNTLRFINGTNGSWSFTATGASVQQMTISGFGLLLMPGLYWGILRNTSTTNTFGIRTIGQGTMTPINIRRQQNSTGIAALGSTIDISGFGSATGQVLMVMQGSIGNEGGAF